MKKILFLSIMYAFTSFASTPILLWDNQDGFVAAKNCSVSSLKNNQFRISKYFGNLNLNAENLRSYNGQQLSHLANGSLVKLTDATKKANYKAVEVVGVNAGIDIGEQERWPSKRLDLGYLYYRSVLPVEDFVIEILDNDELASLNNNLIKAQGTYWKIAAESTYFKLDCQDITSDREYVIFNVYNKHQMNPTALVAVYWDETAIFRSIKTHTKQAVLSILPNIYSEQSIETIIGEGSLQNGLGVDADESVNIDDDLSPTVIDINNIDPDAVIGSNEDVVCVAPSNKLNVRDDGLNKITFSAKTGERVKVFQGWGNEPQFKVVNGNKYEFVKTQFTDREATDQNIGWVAKIFIRPKSKCPHVNGNIVIRDYSADISGLDDPKCCEFPTIEKATHRFNEGMRQFGAGRSGGKRLHAACDLYRYEDEPILSIAPGQVIQDIYYFYQGTYALEVIHSGGFVVRYGEITSKLGEGVKAGAEITMGQRIGHIGKVNSNCCRPMLHFELYEGSKSGSLSGGTNKYQRRSDLMNPTTHLLKWESERFQ